MNKTSIEWTEMTFNPVTGCTPISDGCANCYAKAIAHRFWKDREFDDIQYFPGRLKEIEKINKPTHVFVCSMGDLFHRAVDFETIAMIFIAMALQKKAIFQVLTKRAERMRAFTEYFMEQHTSTHKLPENIWLGVTVENQKAAEERIPPLQAISKAKVRFLSCEPLIAPVDLYPVVDEINKKNGLIDWIIAGGETGQHARPMHPDWLRKVRDFAQDAGTPFFFKSWGEFVDFENMPPETKEKIKPWVKAAAVDVRDGHFIKEAFFKRHATYAKMVKVGKAKAGRRIDDSEWNQYAG